jgi:hypothetical protein
MIFLPSIVKFSDFKTCPVAKSLKFENLTIKTGQALKFEI